MAWLRACMHRQSEYCIDFAQIGPCRPGPTTFPNGDEPRKMQGGSPWLIECLPLWRIIFEIRVDFCVGMTRDFCIYCQSSKTSTRSSLSENPMTCRSAVNLRVTGRTWPTIVVMIPDLIAEERTRRILCSPDTTSAQNDNGSHRAHDDAITNGEQKWLPKTRPATFART